ncbi:GNVR domain-containing protein [Desulfonatronospira sp.]|uniref:GumC family protein n=1 Tax=Desulfonatronospira sp. TaxID=1962951 RepID=UPI0025C001BB|nr:GNVR domain-containing protein [Desulfonatronospira sp.]
MLQIPRINWRPYLELVIRRKWWIVFPVILSLAAGWVYLQQTPSSYRASTLILVESQRVPRDFVPTTVTDDLSIRLQTISQQVNSRSNLEEIIKRFELHSIPDDSRSFFAEIKGKILPVIGFEENPAEKDEPENISTQQLVRYVRSKIDITLRAQNRAFEISFEWGDPQTAARVANALASQFIDQNLRARESMAMGTTRFLDGEVQRLQQELQEREMVLEDFKRRNMGSLPNQLQSNLNILTQLKDEQGRLEEQAQNVLHEMQVVRRLYAAALADRELGMQQGQGGGYNPYREVEALEERLNQLRARYTEQHPELVVLKRIIEQKRMELDRIASMEPIQLETANPAGNIFQHEEHRVELEQMQRRLNVLERRKRDLESQIRVYESRVEQTSEVELELMNLERDYNAVNERYQNLLRRKLDAELAEQMERRQQGEQFRVVDQAIPPSGPFSPDRNRIMLLSLALGMGMGAGLAYLREGMDPALYSAEEAKDFLQPAMLISLPLVKGIKKDKKRGGGL